MIKIEMVVRELRICSSAVTWVLYGHWEATSRPVLCLSQAELVKLCDRLDTSWKPLWDPYSSITDTKDQRELWGTILDSRAVVSCSNEELRALIQALDAVAKELKDNPIEMKVVIESDLKGMQSIASRLRNAANSDLQ